MRHIPGFTFSDIYGENPNALVFRGRRHADGRPVVIKTPRDLQRQSAWLHLYKREFEILRDLASPFTAEPLDLIAGNGQLALVFADKGGVSMHHLLEKNKPDLKQALTWALGVAEALEIIHQGQVAHLALRPWSIMLMPETRGLFLVDFPLAMRLDLETPVGAHQYLFQTDPAYIAPEQTGRFAAVVDHRADLYALGAVLYELLVGRRAFTGQDAWDVAWSHLSLTPTPPHVAVTGIPEPVSDLVMRLLAKSPEDRYRTAASLREDLAECLAQWEAKGRIDRFSLSRRGGNGTFQLSRRLYGREAALATLENAYRAVRSRSGAHIVLVAGHAGTGKTSLVEALQKSVAAEGGRFIAGKCDPLRENVPYNAIHESLTRLIGLLYCARESELIQWVNRIQEALGPMGGVMTEFVPELGNILGPQPQPPEALPLEARNRFHLAFIRFLQVFCLEGEPLVLFLDDLQWAGPATFSLIEAVVTHPSTNNLLVVGAYRDNETHAGHALSAAMGRLRRHGAPIARIVLGNLAPPDIKRLVTDSLIMAPRDAGELAAFCAMKTEGNPFFLTQLLRTLHSEGALTYNERRGRWDWSAVMARNLDLSQDLAGFLAHRLDTLPPDTRRLLGMAACLGFRFDLRDLSSVTGEPASRIHRQLLGATQVGLVLPLTELEPETLDAPDAPMVVFRHRFPHDRIRQAAYDSLDAPVRQEIHLTHGRRLLATLGPEDQQDRLFEVADHLNAGRELMTDPAERVTLAELNLNAARKAQRSLAFASADRLLATGWELLPSDPWDDHHDLAFRMALERAQVAGLAGDTSRSRDLIALCREKAASDRERLDIDELAIRGCLFESRFSDILPLAAPTLQWAGLKVPDTISSELMENALTALLDRIGPHPSVTLAALPVNTDPLLNQAMGLINTLGKASIFVDPNLTRWLAIQVIGPMLDHGIFPGILPVFIAFGHQLLCRGNIDLGYDFGILALELLRRFDHPGRRCEIHLVFGSSLMPFKRGLAEADPYLEDAVQVALAVGEHQYLLAGSFTRIMHAFFQGRHLDEVDAMLNGYDSLYRNLNYSIVGFNGAILHTVIANLKGATVDHHTFDTPAIRGTELQDQLNRQGDPFGNLLFPLFKAQACYIHGEYETAAECLDCMTPYLPFDSITGVIRTEIPFYQALVPAARYDGLSPEERREAARAMDLARSRLEFWAAHCPENFRSRQYLVEAEIARVTDRPLEAAEGYEKAAAAAEEDGFLQIAALANERAGRFWLARGNRRLAGVCLTAAHERWQRWGAQRKVERFEREFLDHLEVHAEAAAPAAHFAAEIASPQGAESWEATAVVKAAQAIGREMDEDAVCARLMEIVLHHTGAQKAFLILREGDGWVIRARDGVCFAPESTLPVDGNPDLCPAVVHFVARARKPLALDDAFQEGEFVNDPYIAANHVRSLLCLPILASGQITGLLYLENNALPRVFTQNYLEFLELLAAQAAISLANARLYTDLADRTRGLEEANAALRVLLQERETDRTDLEKNLMATLRQVVFPYIRKLRAANLTPEQTAFLDVLDANLHRLTASYVRQLSSLEHGLTPMELQVAELIRAGHTTDEIADLLHISSGTVSFHRNNIRVKLGLSRQKVSLRVHLMKLQG